MGGSDTWCCDASAHMRAGKGRDLTRESLRIKSMLQTA